MEDESAPENARLPGEKREVFLSRMLLLVLDELTKRGAAGDFKSVRDALAHDNVTHVRSGRARPGGRV